MISKNTIDLLEMPIEVNPCMSAPFAIVNLSSNLSKSIENTAKNSIKGRLNNKVLL